MKTKKDKDDAESCQSTNNPSEWKGRTIEIDDAGTGDLVGDAFIGFRDSETGKIIFQSVPVHPEKPLTSVSNIPYPLRHPNLA